jgi:cell division protein FtsQ
MARKGSPTISQEELYPSSEEFVRPALDDTRGLDLDVEEESPFLRAQKRVSVRRSTIPKKAVTPLKWAFLVIVILVLASIAGAGLYHYGERSWRFRVESSDDIEISGTHNVTHAQVMEVLGGDIGRNIFFIPLTQRKTQLEQIPWVESASVMRFVPNRLKVEIKERTPVAFARVGSRISLTDENGVLMDLPTGVKRKFSFPVILGTNAGEPPSTRFARMKIYNQLVRELDSGGGHYSQDLSEVDLSDPDDVKVVANDPQGAVLVHLGSSNFLDRYKVYVGHVQEWRQQFDRLESVDLRYDRQIIVNPDLRGAPKQSPLSASAARAAAAAGVKPTALVAHDSSRKKSVDSPQMAPTKAALPVATKTAPKPKVRIVRAKLSARSSLRRAAKAQRRPTTVPSSTGKTVNPQPGKGNTATISKKPSPAIAKEQATQ